MLRICFPLLMLLFVTPSAWAVPLLQLYVEGGTYNETTESWELTPVGSSGGAPFRIWTIGNVAGPGGKGTIENVRLSIAFGEEYLGLDILLTPALIDGDGAFAGFFDTVESPSAEDNTEPGETISTSLGSFIVGGDGVVTNGSSPMLGSAEEGTEKPLPAHGIYGAGTVWKEFGLGDFDQTTDTIGDFIGSFPTELTHNAGQINAYNVSVLNGSGATLHFDLYDTIEAGNHMRATFAPFSHDADGDANIIPEPSALLVWGALAGLCVMVRQRRRHPSKPDRSAS